jgi:predicted phosphodiesterase
MKFIFLSDTHIRATAPEGRTDDFLSAQWAKWKFIFKTARQRGVRAILQAGDLFNEPAPSYSLVYEFASLLNQYPDIDFITIPGQHDLYMRSTDLKRTAMGLLSSFGVLEVAVPGGWAYENVAIFGAGWGIEPNRSVIAGDINILLVHDMIGDKPLYPGHKLTDAESYLRTFNEFQIIITGDYHYPYRIEDGERVILNTGCLLRMTRLERDKLRRPHFYIWDSVTNELERVSIPVRDWRQVFKADSLAANGVDASRLYEFIENLKQSQKIGLSFLDNLETYLSQNNVSRDVKKLIEEVMYGTS